jgi:hypothetical protein
MAGRYLPDTTRGACRVRGGNALAGAGVHDLVPPNRAWGSPDGSILDVRATEKNDVVDPSR